MLRPVRLRVRLPTSLSAEEGGIPCAPRLIGEPVVTLIGHERDGFNLHLKDREEEAEWDDRFAHPRCVHLAPADRGLTAKAQGALPEYQLIASRNSGSRALVMTTSMTIIAERPASSRR